MKQLPLRCSSTESFCHYILTVGHWMGNLGQNLTSLAPPTDCHHTCQNPPWPKAVHQSGRGSRRRSQSQLVRRSKLTRVKVKPATWSEISRRYTVGSLFSPPHRQEECVSWWQRHEIVLESPFAMDTVRLLCLHACGAWQRLIKGPDGVLSWNTELFTQFPFTFINLLNVALIGIFDTFWLLLNIFLCV